jgi:hypothetical protein
VEHVRTAAGVEYFHEPIGSPIDGRNTGVQSPSQFMHPSTGAPMGKSEIGDTFEELFRQKGAHLLEKRYGQPYSPIAHAKVKGGLSSRTTPLDFKLDGTHGGELKTLNAKAKSQKTAIKKEELARKYDAIRKMGAQPLLAVQVVDMDKKEVHVYAHNNFGSKRVAALEHLGSYTFSQKDFREAQQATGHWDKRQLRAATAAGSNPAGLRA